MISVIIPALNEGRTIGQIVELAKKSAFVSEVIVVDDRSLDNTVEEAQRAGATVITSTRLGKGASMKEGILYASNPVLVFLDADIASYPRNIIQLLSEPILKDEADFTKSFFSRQAGRVTELVAKPLLSILYPEFPTFVQPLSGMIAGRRQLLKHIELEEGYGVDIGILIDMYQRKARIREVYIGHIENAMHPLEVLGKMSREVASVILKKSRDKRRNNFETVKDIQLIREQMDFAIRENSSGRKKIALFDMDNTLLRRSFIYTAAERFGFSNELLEIVTTQPDPFMRTKQIACLLKGRNICELLKLVEEIEVTDGTREIVEMLKGNGFTTGILSDSYECITNHLKNRFGFDFSLANELEFSRSVATGEVNIPCFFLPHAGSVCAHEYCKSHAMTHLCTRHGLPVSDVLAIGDGENDVCMIRQAGIGVSFCATSKLVDPAADLIIKKPDFRLLSQVIEKYSRKMLVPVKREPAFVNNNMSISA